MVRARGPVTAVATPSATAAQSGASSRCRAWACAWRMCSTAVAVAAAPALSGASGSPPSTNPPPTCRQPHAASRRRTPGAASVACEMELPTMAGDAASLPPPSPTTAAMAAVLTPTGGGRRVTTCSSRAPVSVGCASAVRSRPATADVTSSAAVEPPNKRNKPIAATASTTATAAPSTNASLKASSAPTVRGGAHAGCAPSGCRACSACPMAVTYTPCSSRSSTARAGPNASDDVAASQLRVMPPPGPADADRPLPPPPTAPRAPRFPAVAAAAAGRPRVAGARDAAAASAGGGAAGDSRVAA